MTLVKKSISSQNAVVLQWLLCFPVRIPSMILCCLCCGPSEDSICVQGAVGPCLNYKIDNLADKLTHKIISKLNFRHLCSSSWSSEDLDFILLLEPSKFYPNWEYPKLYSYIQPIISNIFDCYDFDFVKINDLTDTQLELIAEAVTKAILLRLPSKETFFKFLHENNISPIPNCGHLDDEPFSKDEKRIHSYLINSVIQVLKGDFIKDQLNSINNAHPVVNCNSNQAFGLFTIKHKSDVQTSNKTNEAVLYSR